MTVSDTINQSHSSLFDLYSSCTVIELSENSSLNFLLDYDANGRYAVITKLLGEGSGNQCPEKRQICVGDVLFSVNEHTTLDDDIDEILMFLETLQESRLNRKLTFLDPSRVAEAAHLQTKNQSKDLLGFSRDLDYLLRERIFNNANLSTTAQRDLEWVAYLKHIGGPDNLKPAGNFEPSSELKCMVRRGIPAAFRSLIWQKISLSSLHRLNYPATYYSDLVSRSVELNNKVADDIEKDVKRTFPEHDYFDRGIGMDSLRSVLKAYALHNPAVGYCQSLNFISGMMLLFLQEEDAFWLLLTVVDTLLPKDSYSNNMVGTHVDQLVFSNIIETSLPKIHMALSDTQMDLSLVTIPWFMCLFANTLIPEVTLRVWDMFFCEGSKVLFRIAAALLKKNEVALVAAGAKDMTALFLEMKNIGKNELDADALIAMAYKSYTPPAPKPHRLFTSMRGAFPGNTASSGSRSAVDTPLRKYNEFSSVPSDLLGMGVAHTGPVFLPVKQVESRQSPLSLDSDNETVNELKDTVTIEDSAAARMRAYKATDSGSESSLGSSTVSLSRVQAVEIVKIPQMLPVQTFSSVRIEEESYSTGDCSCFDKFTATAILQLGMSAFKTYPYEVDGKRTLTDTLQTTPSSTQTSPSSSRDSPSCGSMLSDKDFSPSDSTQQKETDTLPVSGSTRSQGSSTTQRKKITRGANSLLNLLLSSNSGLGGNSDSYRSFKRADIDRLRSQFRLAVIERYCSLDSVPNERFHQVKDTVENALACEGV